MTWRIRRPKSKNPMLAIIVILLSLGFVYVLLNGLAVRP